MTEFPRRFLPAMSQLRAFESAARHQSFTVAAGELSLTQSAVSRQIRALEDLLGSELFVRDKQLVRLTVAGENYAEEIRAALRQVSSATHGFGATPNGGTLNIAILSTFGTKWLAPRLQRFMKTHSGVNIKLTTRLAPFDFHTNQIDAAVHFGMPEWPGAKLDYLMSESVVPACGRSLLKGQKLLEPRQLLDLPLLHLTSRPDAWRQWFEAVELPCEHVPGMEMDQFAIAVQAAIAGVGVALLPTFLIRDEIERGELVIPVERPVASREHYYLAWPVSRENYPPLGAFRSWIQEEARSENMTTGAGQGFPSP